MKRAACWLIYATVPVAIFFEVTRGNRVLLFVFSCLAVLPLAAWIGISAVYAIIAVGMYFLPQ